MKTQIRNVVSILAMGLILLACNKGSDDLSIQYADEADVLIEDAVELGSISINPIFKDAISVLTGKAPILEEVLDIMAIDIRDNENNYILSNLYRTFPEYIELAPGNYRFDMYNWNGYGARFDNPVYGTRTLDFKVSSGVNTVLDVSLGLFDVAITINLSEALKTNYPDITVNVDVFNFYFGSSIDLTWDIVDDERTGYFDLVERNNPFFGDIGTTIGDLVIIISASGTAGVPINVSRLYPGVSANEHYVISIEYSSASSLSLNITLDDEVVINETITFPN